MKVLYRLALTAFLALLPFSLANGEIVPIAVPLDGGQQVPPVATPGTGTGTLTVDLVAQTIAGSVAFSGLTAPTTAGHIHQGAAGINGPVIIPLIGGLGLTAGAMIIPPTPLTPILVAALQNNELYLNIHTETNLGGEIRGQIIFPVSPGSTDAIVFIDVKSGDFDQGRPGAELVALDIEGGIFVSSDLMTWKQIPGTLKTLVSGDFNGDGVDDIAGIGEDGDIFFTIDFGVTWMEIPSPVR